MNNVNELNLEDYVARSEAKAGYVDEIAIPLGAWTLDTGGGLGTTSANLVYREQVGASPKLNAISWDDTADASDIARFDWTLPGHFRNGAPVNTIAKALDSSRVAQAAGTDSGPYKPYIALLAKIRLTDLSPTTDNTTLRLTCQAVWGNDGDTAFNTLASAISVDPAVATPETTEEGFAWVTFNITGAMTATQRRALKPYASFQIQLLPNQAIATSLRLDVVSTVIRYARHLSLVDRANRVVP